MVHIKRIIHEVPSTELEIPPEELELVKLTVSEPEPNPKEELTVYARPYEFALGKAMKFSSLCPH